MPHLLFYQRDQQAHGVYALFEGEIEVGFVLQDLRAWSEDAAQRLFEAIAEILEEESED